MYLMISTYLKPIDEVNAAREEHLAFLKGLPDGVLVAAGRREPVTGGVVMLDVATQEEAMATMATDPYLKRGLASYEPFGWTPTIGALADITSRG